MPLLLPESPGVKPHWPRPQGREPEVSILAEPATNLANRIEALLAWVPAGVTTAVLLALAALVALFAHAVIVRLMRGTLARRHPFVATLTARTHGPARLGLVLLALNLLLPALPYEARASQRLGQLLLIALIALIGWLAVRVVELATDLYLGRLGAEPTRDALARQHVTQVKILKRAVETLIVVIAVALALMTFESVRHYGVSLFASAGVAGLVVGLAARPLLSNLFAGIQLAITQPIRLDDAVLVENQWGTVEEITSTYVVIRLFDSRRLLVPLGYFIEKPFQNWTRDWGGISGAVALNLPLAADVERLRQQVQTIVARSPRWDGRIAKLEVSDLKEAFVQVQVTVSARSFTDLWTLHCELREQLHAATQNRHESSSTTAAPATAPAE
jgi:small-conductance mechanosensitive channel